MKTSVYIPTDGWHIAKLDSIVEAYNRAKVRPDEIVINACGVENVKSLKILTKLYEKGYDNVKIYAKKTFESIADNMNLVTKVTENEIVLFHNPNVIPSVKRVEMVKNYFENNEIKVLHHTCFKYDLFLDGDLDLIPEEYKTSIKSQDLYKRYFPFGDPSYVWQHTHHYGQEFNIHDLDNTSVCVHKSVLSDTKWKNDYEFELYRGYSNGMGYEFALETLYKYNKSDILNMPLTIIK